MTLPVLFIQIPCFNEEKTLGTTLDALPRSIPGVERIEVLIIDDGSSDKTREVAKAHGVKHIVGFRQNRGLAKAYSTGLEACLVRGADIIVNTDADNQYCADDIPALIQPLLEHRADIVIGARPIETIAHFSLIKKILQRLGSAVVRHVSGTDVADAPSGFRAVTADVARQLHVFGDYTYTIETIIQAGQKGFKVVSVPVRVNEDLRPSRLVKSIPDYIMRNIVTMGRIYLIYRPLRLFIPVALATFASGLGLGLRYLYLNLQGFGQGHIHSVILSALLLTISGFTALFGVLAELTATNRKLLERLDTRLQSMEPAQTPTRSSPLPIEPESTTASSAEELFEEQDQPAAQVE